MNDGFGHMLPQTCSEQRTARLANLIREGERKILGIMLGYTLGISQHNFADDTTFLVAQNAHPLNFYIKSIADVDL
jgi:hypothetical protein